MRSILDPQMFAARRLHEIGVIVLVEKAAIQKTGKMEAIVEFVELPL
jgi:hypothetical protein